MGGVGGGMEWKRFVELGFLSVFLIFSLLLVIRWGEGVFLLLLR